MSYSSVIKLLGCTREIKFEECNAGNNALDFQLISYLGYLMKNEELKDSEFIVMSNDTGYDPAVNFWKKENFSFWGYYLLREKKRFCACICKWGKAIYH